MARTRQWSDDSSMEIKFASGSSVSVNFKGNLFFLLPQEQQLIADLTSLVRQYNDAREPEPLVETKQS